MLVDSSTQFSVVGRLLNGVELERAIAGVPAHL